MSDSARPSSKPAINQNAERLKIEGNQLHQQGHFRSAYDKYSEAIKEDSSNPIYFANRAASSLALKEYLDAAADSLKATELDPQYAKAWSRYATACFNLCSWTKSINAWKKAIECLPSEAQSTETDKRLRSQFTAGLKKSQEASAAPAFQASMIQGVTPNQMPWHKAQIMEGALQAVGKMSSAFVILGAYRSFKEGVDIMKTLEQKKMNGQLAWVGKPNALELISNGVIEDPRVFHFDSSDWMQKYNNQVIFEAQMHRAWTKGGTNIVKKESVERLKKEGWAKVRPALATTIRAWIMCGFQSLTISRNHKLALEYFTRAEEVLKWGSNLWEKVSTKDRGVVFEKTFIRAVCRMRLKAMYEYRAQGQKDCFVTFDDIIKYSEELVAEVEANVPGTVGATLEIAPATLGSFYMYPRAEALSTLGWCYTQRGLTATTAKDAQELFTKSQGYYFLAAECLPLDDEYAAVYFKAAVETQWWMPEPQPVMNMLSTIARVHESFQAYQKLWEHSAIARERDPQIQHALAFALDCFAALAQGKIVESDIVKPMAVKRKDKWAGPEVVYI